VCARHLRSRTDPENGSGGANRRTLQNLSWRDFAGSDLRVIHHPLTGPHFAGSRLSAAIESDL
jgi:hypothetical protein